MWRILKHVLTPSDTHCATGEPCCAEKYCPKGNILDKGICKNKSIDKSNVEERSKITNNFFDDKLFDNSIKKYKINSYPDTIKIVMKNCAKFDKNGIKS